MDIRSPWRGINGEGGCKRLLVHHAALEDPIIVTGLRSLSIEDNLLAFAFVVIGAFVVDADHQLYPLLTRLDASSWERRESRKKKRLKFIQKNLYI